MIDSIAILQKDLLYMIVLILELLQTSSVDYQRLLIVIVSILFEAYSFLQHDQQYPYLEY